MVASKDYIANATASPERLDVVRNDLTTNHNAASNYSSYVEKGTMRVNLLKPIEDTTEIAQLHGLVLNAMYGISE